MASYASARAHAPLPLIVVKQIIPGGEVLISFPDGLQKYSFDFEFSTSGNKRIMTGGDLNIDAQNSGEARDSVFFCLEETTMGKAKLAVEKVGAASIIFRGYKDGDGTLIPVVSVTLRLRDVKNGGPTVTALGSAKTSKE